VLFRATSSKLVREFFTQQCQVRFHLKAEAFLLIPILYGLGLLEGFQNIDVTNWSAGGAELPTLCRGCWLAAC